MSDSIEWNLEIALNLTYSLKEFVDLKFPDITSENIITAWSRINYIYQWTEGYQMIQSKNLAKVLAYNGWTISCKENDLINLPEQGRLRCSNNEILIIKSKPGENVSAVAKDNCYFYFLVAALSWNGKTLCNWKNGSWNEVRSSYYYVYQHSEPYYFYYCKVTPQFFVKFLWLENISREYRYKALHNISYFTKLNENLFEYHESSRSNFDEETKVKIEKENNEIIEKLNEDKIIENLNKRIEELETIINSDKELIKQYENNKKELEESNKSLEKMCESLEIEKKTLIQTIKEKDTEIYQSKMINQHNTQAINQLNDKLKDLNDKINSLEAENSTFKSSISENESIHQNLIKENGGFFNGNQILQEKCKTLEEELNKINYSQQSFNQENEIIRLLPNRKHGLPNFGNTCYLNSLLQIFASSPYFIKKIKNTKSLFCSSLSTLLAEMHYENSSKIITNLIQNFHENLIETYSNIEANTQHSVKEAFNMILSKIEEDGESLDLFSIGFHQKLTCGSWRKHQSQYHDIQTFLIIPTQHKDSIANYLRNLRHHYSSKQKLICDDCGEEVDMNIELKNIDWPVYLVLYFPTPPNNIAETIYIDYKYYIYGVICYYQDQGCSHYTAFTRDENEWNEYNDEHVETRKLDPHVVHLAFYSKKSRHI